MALHGMCMLTSAPQWLEGRAPCDAARGCGCEAPLAAMPRRTALTGLMAYVLAFILAGAAQAAPQCNGQAEGSTDYARAADAVLALPEFQAWSRSLAFPVAFGTANDRQIWVHGRCDWSVSVYADRPGRLELWHVFYVHPPGKVAYVQELQSGRPIALRAWRLQNKVAGKNH